MEQLPEKIILEFPTGFVEIYVDFFSRRIRVDNYQGDIRMIIKSVRDFAPEWTEKIIFKSRSADIDYLKSRNLIEEGFIEGYFSGSIMFFMTEYLKSERAVASASSIEQMIQNFEVKSHSVPRRNLSVAVPLSLEDADSIAQIFTETFTFYPTPMNRPDYERSVIQDGTLFFGVKESGKLVSVASAEINSYFGNAELTDCASLIECRGKGYIKTILEFIQTDLKNRDILCHYTLARANEPGINKVFFDLGFKFCGVLRQNCRIGSGMEDMVVWVQNHMESYN
jgi:putative beta-lysine N-acetyltransferase